MPARSDEARNATRGFNPSTVVSGVNTCESFACLILVPTSSSSPRRIRSILSRND